MKNTKWLLLSVLFISSLFGQIDIKVSDGYKVKKGIGGYTVELSPNGQTLIKILLLLN